MSPSRPSLAIPHGEHHYLPLSFLVILPLFCGILCFSLLTSPVVFFHGLESHNHVPEGRKKCWCLWRKELYLCQCLGMVIAGREDEVLHSLQTQGDGVPLFLALVFVSIRWVLQTKVSRTESLFLPPEIQPWAAKITLAVKNAKNQRSCCWSSLLIIAEDAAHSHLSFWTWLHSELRVTKRTVCLLKMNDWLEKYLGAARERTNIFFILISKWKWKVQIRALASIGWSLHKGCSHHNWNHTYHICEFFLLSSLQCW